MRYISTICIVAAVACAAFSPSVVAGFEQSGEVLKKEREVSVSTVARVVGINLTNRRIILEDEHGKAQTFVASEDIQRLAEFEPGDKVEIDYHMSLLVELREPTAEEQLKPLEVDEVGGRNTEDYEPGGGKMRTIRAVCTVEGLDRPSETLTLLAPDGTLRVHHVENVENLSKLRIGDTLIVTFTEALAIRLEKVQDL